MKTYPRRRRAHHPRVPAFVPVPLRNRADGWTPKRQAAFLAQLALTRSVREAARRVGMARETAYRLRARRGAESFAAAWDAALGRGNEGGRKVTHGERARRAFEELRKPVIYAGKHVGTVRKADTSALLGHYAHLTRTDRLAGATSGRSQGFDPCPVSPSDPPAHRQDQAFRLLHARPISHP
ncbi:MAG: hypothetical protein P0Y56_09495 [Candidatus Andeanibacterium colombiense]|uniref:Helix-turn-helix domain-containing protein n=1 Tax=Candidatus Andeanibacterium colombiense TaxID=3121345 RepID=A0AAJ5X3H2_9SPHN|nr:MAG: hypothetical protein P0Y56_09495 [Sphingomonadaceae bacterium]